MINVTPGEARLETWTAVCIDDAGQEWRVNSSLAQPAPPKGSPGQDPYPHAFTGTPYTSVDGAVSFTIIHGAVPFTTGDTLTFTTTGITAVSDAVMIVDGQISEDPTAVIRACPLRGLAPLTVMFDARGSFDPNGEPLEFRWNFGDGSPPVFGAIVKHTFVDPAVYTAVLRATTARREIGAAETYVAWALAQTAASRA